MSDTERAVIAAACRLADCKKRSHAEQNMLALSDAVKAMRAWLRPSPKPSQVRP